MSENKKPRTSGKLINANHALPPVHVDCSDRPRSEGSRSSGMLVNPNHALPSVKVSTQVPEQVFLELRLTLAEDADVSLVFIRVACLIERLDTMEKSLGGAGIEWKKDFSDGQNGQLVLVLAAKDGLDARERFKRLADEINRSIGMYLGAAKAIVTVYSLKPNGQRECDYAIKYPGAV